MHSDLTFDLQTLPSWMRQSIWKCGLMLQQGTKQNGSFGEGGEFEKDQLSGSACDIQYSTKYVLFLLVLVLAQFLHNR